MSETDYDLCVVGGGINGAAIARDAAGRGLSVILLEAGDLASATSSASTKLIHGGLRYLEYYEFRLVRASLKERELLLRAAPHLIRPMDFILPHDETQRPAWMIRAGLFLYDHLSKRRTLKASKMLDLTREDSGKPLAKQFTKGFQYSDCWADDARLVVLNALDAQEKGAEICTRTACTFIEQQDTHWQVSARDMLSGIERKITAAMIINATGPWVRDVAEASGLAAPDLPKVRLIKGSHIVVPRQYKGAQAYILQQPDKRIVFAIPYEGAFTMIGTTEEAYEGDPSQATISPQEVEYLCAAFNRSFEKPIAAEDIVWAYSGVRPLLDDGHDNATSVTRDYKIYAHKNSGALMLSVFGGKLTTHRILAEEVMDELMHISNRAGCGWTRAHPLPGGDIPDSGIDTYISEQEKRYPWLPSALLRRYAHAYGTRMERILSGARALEDLGRDCGDYIFEAELVYLIRYEWARSLEDILWRRSKLGLHIAAPTLQALESSLPDLIRRHTPHE